MKNTQIVVVIVLFLLAIFTFMDSYHKTDLAVNAIANGLINFEDEGAFGNKVLVKDMYLMGIRGLFISFWIYNLTVIVAVTLYLRKDN